jgi:hypothetical protein
MAVLPTFPLSQIWGVDTGIHGDDLLYRFKAVADNVGMENGVLPESQQRLSESVNQAPYQQYPGELNIDVNSNWVGDPIGAENRRLPDSNLATNGYKISTGFGKNNGDSFTQLADLAISQLPAGIRSFAQMVEPELRKLIPVETIATIEKGRELYEVAQQISASWQKLSTVNQILPFDKAPTDIKIPGLEAENNFINSSIFGGRVKVAPQNDSQISWYLNPTFSSAYQNVGANDLPGNYYV